MQIESQYLLFSRGVPEVLFPEFFNQRFIPPPFNSAECIQRVEFDKGILPLYPSIKRGRVVLLTWIMPDGMGDYYAQRFLLDLLEAINSEIQIETLSIAHACFMGSFPSENVEYYQDDVELHSEPFFQRVLSRLNGVEAVVQIPTCLPFWDRLKGRIPSSTTIGEYGFLDSTWCHPMTGNRCMGLHGLEYGIMVKEAATLRDEENRKPFFVGYLVSERGARLYLRTIAELSSHTDEDITIVLPGFEKWASALGEDPKLFPFLKNRGISQIHITVDSFVSIHPLQKIGKTLFLRCRTRLEQETYKSLIASSRFLAVRGDQSFSEALSFGKPFFYDGAAHAKPFIKDLIAIADDFLDNPTLSRFLRLFLKDPSIAEKPFRDVRFMEEQEEDLDQKGIECAALLLTQELENGFQKLRQWITSHHNANQTLIHIVHRTILHAQRPEIAVFEKQLLQKYCDGDIDLTSARKTLQRML